jgi:hypothetical protein
MKKKLFFAFVMLMNPKEIFLLLSNPFLRRFQGVICDFNNGNVL